MQPSDVVRKILSVLSINKYGNIVTMLHQDDLSTATPTQILEKINAHEMYMHITPQDSSSSNKKKDKDLAFKASQEKDKERLEYESSSDDEVDDASLALMVRKIAKMLKKLNKSGIKFDDKKKFFTSSRRNSTRRRKVGRHTSSVIGSRILIHQVAHSMIKVRTRRWPLL